MISRDRFIVSLFAAGLTVISAPFAQADAMQQSYGSSGQPTNSSGQLQNFTNSQHDQYSAGTYFLETGAKFANGLANLASAPVEIPKNIINTANESNLIYGITGGSLKGILNMGGRVLVGLTDLLTFSIPTKPIAYPRYVWEDFDSDTSYGQTFRMQEMSEEQQ